MVKEKQIYESGENYLETILLLKNKKGNVRSVDIVEELGYSKSSVSRAVNILKEKNFIQIDSGGQINFTEQGEALAQKTYEKHEVLMIFLQKLGVEKNIAENDACKIEHVLSKQSFEAIKSFIKD
ncbi:MAG: metal-dependent transcriptional regulator [Clostridia bacterium]